jgi:hypothetical protein
MPRFDYARSEGSTVLIMASGIHDGVIGNTEPLCYIREYAAHRLSRPQDLRQLLSRNPYHREQFVVPRPPPNIAQHRDGGIGGIGHMPPRHPPNQEGIHESKLRDLRIQGWFVRPEPGDLGQR